MIKDGLAAYRRTARRSPLSCRSTRRRPLASLRLRLDRECVHSRRNKIILQQFQWLGFSHGGKTWQQRQAGAN